MSFLAEARCAVVKSKENYGLTDTVHEKDARVSLREKVGLLLPKGWCLWTMSLLVVLSEMTTCTAIEKTMDCDESSIRGYRIVC